MMKIVVKSIFSDMPDDISYKVDTIVIKREDDIVWVVGIAKNFTCKFNSDSVIMIQSE